MAALTLVAGFPGAAWGQLTVSTVPFDPTSPLKPHPSWNGNTVTLKATMSSPAWGTDSFSYDWNPGDGGTHCTGTVTNQYVISCPHVYYGSGSASGGATFNAILTVTDTTTSATATGNYYTQLFTPPPNLPIEVDNAIDNGLWYIHTTMVRTTSSYGAAIGNWIQNNGANDDVAQSGGTGPIAIYCTAFEVNGFLTTNSPQNPYSQDVALCLNGVLDNLATQSMSQIAPYNVAPFTPDYNGNGIGVQHNQYPENYQTGMEMDSLAASGTPAAVVPANTALGHAVSGITGSGAGGAYTFKDAIFDMVDDYSYCMNLGSPSPFTADAGGWHYSCQEETGDNSVSQWAAIGIIPARRSYGVDPLNPAVLTTDQTWLVDSFTQASTNNGYFGYTDNSPLWGPYAVTPSGLVQLAMNGQGRGTTVGGENLWDSAETYIRDNFGNPQNEGPYDSLKAYYYGMFSFTKSMLLHDNSGTGLGNTPIQYLQSSDDPMSCAAPGVPVTSPGSGTGPCYPQIDWYAAQSSTYGGIDPTDGVARTLVQDQNPDGSWFGHNASSAQYYFETAVSLIMLKHTVFNAVPVACFTATPSTLANGGPVTLSGNCSTDQNPANTIVSYKWDTDGTGGTTFNIAPGSPSCKGGLASCVSATFRVTAPVGSSFPYNYPVRLRVTDSGGLTADVVANIVIGSPPNPPSANAGGPYHFCPNQVGGNFIYQPWYLNASTTINPDQGMTDNSTSGLPPSTICNPATAGTTGTSANACGFYWDLSCSGAYNGPTGAQPNVTGEFGPSTYGTSVNVCLQVVNNDNLAFPTAVLASGLASQASTQVFVHNPTDPECAHCVNILSDNAQAPAPGHTNGNTQIYWTDSNSTAFPIDHYNVYRSTNSNFSNFVQVAGANSVYGLAAIPAKTPATPAPSDEFTDSNVLASTTYYYRIAPATGNDTETCNSPTTVTLTVPAAKSR